MEHTKDIMTITESNFVLRKSIKNWSIPGVKYTLYAAFMPYQWVRGKTEVHANVEAAILNQKHKYYDEMESPRG